MTSSSSGNVLILTGGSAPSGTGGLQATTFGTVQASATAGTFAITATLGGTSAAGTIQPGSLCTLN